MSTDAILLRGVARPPGGPEATAGVTLGRGGSMVRLGEAVVTLEG